MTERADLNFDPDALRAKYAQERERRLRPDGIKQYVEISGAFARFGRDPWADPRFTRDPITDAVDVAIVGARFGGLLVGARLKELGVDDVRLIDKAADVGGTWNRSRNCLRRRVLRLHAPARTARLRPDREVCQGRRDLHALRRIAEHYDLYRNPCLHTEVNEIYWSAGDSHWVIATDRGDRIRARFVAMANGYL